MRVKALLRSWPVTGPQRCTLDVFLLLTRQDHVLLALRQGTGFADGQWNLPSGKAESGETAVAAVIREAREEIGIRLTEDEINFAATVHCRNSDTEIRVGLFFQATARQSSLDMPYNAEPHKCAKIAWYPMAMMLAPPCPTAHSASPSTSAKPASRPPAGNPARQCSPMRPAVLDAMKAFFEAWVPAYDVEFYCCDRFAQH